MKLWLFRLLPTAALGLVLGSIWWLWPEVLSAEARARSLNERAWMASYVERGQQVPGDGIREGLWGEKLTPKQPDPELGWRERAIDEGEVLHINGRGRQLDLCLRQPCPRILITGGSVGMGAYASTQSKTWFARLGVWLEDVGQPRTLEVFAAGAWKAAQEVGAARRALAERPYDGVVMMTGLNDLTHGQNARTTYFDRPRDHRGRRLPPGSHDQDWAARETTFLIHLETMANQVAEHARLRGGRGFVLAVMQPALVTKEPRSELEAELLLRSSPDGSGEAGLRALASSYARLRQSAHRLALKVPNLVVVDCADSFDGIEQTTFTDLWHFSDPGHQALAVCVAAALVDLAKPPR